MNKNIEKNKNRQLRRQAAQFVQAKSNPEIVELISKKQSRSVTCKSEESSVLNWNTVKNDALLISHNYPFDDGFSSSDESTVECRELDFQTELQEWVVNCKVSAAHVDKLLPILRKKESTLPKCCKTLVHTPQSNNIVPMDNGNYLTIGIRNELERLLLTNTKIRNQRIALDIFSDGVGVANSSTSCLWPICIRVVEVNEILLTHLFHGTSKPKNVNNFLQPFVDEFNQLKDGFEVNGTTYTLCVRAIIADTPARQFLLNTILHSGYSSCTKCTVHGVRVLNRTTFPGVDFQPRTDASFRGREHADHHHSLEPTMLESLPVDCVSSVPVDVMHCVYLGVVKMLLSLWITVRLKQHSISVKGIQNISNSLLQLAPDVPSDFSRGLRSLVHLSRFKATELRLLTLYILPLVLKNELDGKFYKHFLKLHCAMRILCDRNECIKNNLLASKLLLDFVAEMADLYGSHTLSYNVHNLIHLAGDVLNFNAPLEDFSAFPFENFMQYIKKAAKTGYRVLEQVHNRNFERNYIQNYAGVFKQKKKNDKQFANSNLFKRVFVSNTVLSVLAPDNYVTENGSVFKIEELSKDNSGKIIMKCRNVLNLKCFYKKPVSSIDLNTFEGEVNETFSEIYHKTFSNSVKKCAAIRFGSIILYIGLLH